MFAPRWTPLMQFTALWASIGWPTILPGQQPAAPQARAPQAKGVPAKALPIPPGVKVLKDLEYARIGDRRLLLDLYLPEKGERPLPLIIWVHGGGWAAGSKDQVGAVRQLNRGYAVASLDYRLSSEAIFPAQIEDCKAAVRWLRAHAQKYDLDRNRFGAWGSSAGGHLVALLGTSSTIKDFDTGEYGRPPGSIKPRPGGLRFLRPYRPVANGCPRSTRRDAQAQCPAVA
jgi:acetyl esterase/lipase